MSVLRPDGIDVALVIRLNPKNPRFDEIQSRHSSAIEAGNPSYRDPASGLTVMTSKFLASRGYCCLSGCRHCPFEQAQ
ncbi:MAG: DUF5522 domain-containing protein [Actinomycetota bacterium]|jgi:hypothetical protein